MGSAFPCRNYLQRKAEQIEWQMSMREMIEKIFISVLLLIEQISILNQNINIKYLKVSGIYNLNNLQVIECMEEQFKDNAENQEHQVLPNEGANQAQRPNQITLERNEMDEEGGHQSNPQDQSQHENSIEHPDEAVQEGEEEFEEEKEAQDGGDNQQNEEDQEGINNDEGESGMEEQNNENDGNQQLQEDNNEQEQHQPSEKGEGVHDSAQKQSEPEIKVNKQKPNKNISLTPVSQRQINQQLDKQASQINQPIQNQHPIQIALPYSEKLSQNVKSNLQVMVRQKNLEAYANKLELQIQKKEDSIFQLIAEAMQKTNQLKQIKANLNEKEVLLYNQNEELENTKAQNKMLSKRVTRMGENIEELQGQLEKYREVGDIGTLLRKVEELQVMVATQSRELQIVSQVNKEQANNSMQRITKQQLQNYQNLYNKHEQLQKNFDYYFSQLEKSRKANQENNGIIQRLDTTIKCKITEIDALKQQNLDLTNKCKQTKEIYEVKLHKLEHSLNAAHNLGDGEEHRHQRDLEKQIEEDKEAFYKDYKFLQQNYLGVQEANTDLKNKLHSLRIQMKMGLKSKVNKKDYDEMAHKYRKAKECLERVIKENKLLKSRIQNGNKQDSQMIDEDQINDLKASYNQIEILQNFEEHDNLQEYTKVYTEHLKKSLQFFKSTNEAVQLIHMDKYREQIENLTIQNKKHSARIEQLQRLNHIFQQELVFKNKTIGDLLEKNKNFRLKTQALQKEKLQVQWELLDNFKAKTHLKSVQIGSLGLINKNRRLMDDLEKWKNLYASLKKQFEVFLKREPQSQNHQNSQIEPHNQEMQEEMIPENRAHHVQTQEVEAQTEDQMNQYHYKQLRQVLKQLKRFPSKTKQLQKYFEEKKEVLEKLREKYDSVLSLYNKKLQDLQIEKKKNDTYLAQKKEDLMNQFYDLRELIENDRLLGSLRKAKNLIETLENSGDMEQ